MNSSESSELTVKATADLTQRCHECCQYMPGCNIIVTKPIELQQLLLQLEPYNKRSDIAQIQREFRALLTMRDTEEKIPFSSTAMYSWSPEHWTHRTGDTRKAIGHILKTAQSSD